MTVRCRLLTLLLPAVASASLTIGFRKTAVPVLVLPGEQIEEDVYMLCLGCSTAGGLALELSGGGDRSEGGISEAVIENRTFCIGAGAFQRIASPPHTSLSVGARFDYAVSTSEMEGTAGETETEVTAFSPLLRVDVSLPAAERLGFFLEWGAGWRGASTTGDEPEDPTLEYEYTSSEWRTVAPEDVLAGMAWTF